LACVLYCVSLVPENPVPNLVGIAEQPVVAHESGGFRVYYSDVASPEALLEGAARKAADVKFRQVLRELVAFATPLAFPFPSVVDEVGAIDVLITEQRETYTEALNRLAGMVQLELTATWAVDEQADLATPISGREYQRRHQEAESRVAAIDRKLKSVTAGIVREWRSRQERRTRIWVALLARGDRERFIAALRGAEPSEGVRLRLSGPFPPNEFVSPSV